VDFLKPFVINDILSEKHKADSRAAGDTTSAASAGSKKENMWENGPAAYWYNFYDLENLILEEKKKLEAEKEKLRLKKLKSKKVTSSCFSQ
jgi:hypothetical protein